MYNSMYKSMEIPEFFWLGKKYFRDGSYHYSRSIGLHFKNKENISLFLFKQCTLFKGAIFNILCLLLNEVANSVFSYACIAHIFHLPTHN